MPKSNSRKWTPSWRRFATLLIYCSTHLRLRVTNVEVQYLLGFRFLEFVKVLILAKKNPT
jgi:hypothetical protein